MLGTDVQRDRQTDRHTNGQANEKTGKQMDRQTDGQTDRRMDVKTKPTYEFAKRAENGFQRIRCVKFRKTCLFHIYGSLPAVSNDVLLLYFRIIEGYVENFRLLEQPS